MKANTDNIEKTNQEFVKTPNPTDVLFGRGGKSNGHQGNKHYHSILETRAWEYSQLNGRNAKTSLAWEILHEFQRDGIRFLKYDKDTTMYFEADEEETRKKISQRLRELALEVKEHSTKGEEETSRGAGEYLNTEALTTPIPLEAASLKADDEDPLTVDNHMSQLLTSCFLKGDEPNLRDTPSLYNQHDMLLKSSLHSDCDFRDDAAPLPSWEEINSDYAVCSSLYDLSDCELSTFSFAPLLPASSEFSFDWEADAFRAEHVASNQHFESDEDLRFRQAQRYPEVEPALAYQGYSSAEPPAKRRRESLE